ncbi:MAG: hypothetical protein FK730_01580 [Asgard group archaeon]|nr:hypothetical protein [Asgard group archaeon]
MPNYSILALQAIISSFIGIAFTFLIAMISEFRIGVFWFLLILLWLIIACLNGYFVKSKLDPVIFSLFVALFISVSMFFFSLLLSSFTTALLEALQLNEGGFDQLGILKQAVAITFIISLILFTVQIIGSYSVFLSKRFIQKSKMLSTESIELQAFEKYDTPTDSGTYSQRSDDYE